MKPLRDWDPRVKLSVSAAMACWVLAWGVTRLVSGGSVINVTISVILAIVGLVASDAHLVALGKDGDRVDDGRHVLLALAVALTLLSFAILLLGYSGTRPRLLNLDPPMGITPEGPTIT